VKRLRLTPEAELDLEDAYSWYRTQAPRLAANFLAVVGTCLASIRRHPEAYQLVDPTVRRALLRRFPYAVSYEVGAVEIVVYASVPLREKSSRLEAQTERITSQ
jgi:plasmid stabilization system protein ParE